MTSQWKQFVELYSEKNPHLSHRQVLEMAKKPFAELKKYYRQNGGKNVELFPKCEEQVTSDMLGDDEVEDKLLLKTRYYPNHGELYDKFAQQLQNIIEESCWGVVKNGKTVLYSYYDNTRSDEDELARDNLITNIKGKLLTEIIKSSSNAFFDIYLFADRWYVGRDIEFGPRKYHVKYDASKGTFHVSIYTKSKESFGL
jgi:hypothetical protein